MRKINLKLFFLFACICNIYINCNFAIATRMNNHLFDEAKKRFPYSLIGDDYNILDADDLAIVTCRTIKPLQYSPSKHTSNDYNISIYWKCFSTANVLVDCDGGGSYDKSEHDFLTVMGIIIKSDHEINEYITRRAISVKACKNWKRAWERLSKNQTHACFSGQILNSNTIVENNKPIKRFSWIFESFKTNLGCDSYFDQGCDLKHQIKTGCKVSSFLKSLGL